MIRERPAWHRLAACRGDRRWLVERLTAKSAEELKRVCRRCPVAGECLAEGFDLDPRFRDVVLRCGIVGRSWQRAMAVVAELAPVTPEDWETVAAWFLDRDADDLEVVPGRAGDAVRVPSPRRRVVAKPAGVIDLRRYDTAEVAMTRAALLAARSA